MPPGSSRRLATTRRDYGAAYPDPNSGPPPPRGRRGRDSLIPRHPTAMITTPDPDDELDDLRDPELDLVFEELAYLSDAYSRSQEDGWFYPDED